MDVYIYIHISWDRRPPPFLSISTWPIPPPLRHHGSGHHRSRHHGWRAQQFTPIEQLVTAHTTEQSPQGREKGWEFRRGCVVDTDNFHQPSCLWLKNWRNFILVGNYSNYEGSVCVCVVLFEVSMFWVFLATSSTPNCSWGASRGVPSRWYHAWSFRRCWSSLDLGRLNDQKGAILDGFLPFQIYIRGRPNKRMWWWIFWLGLFSSTDWTKIPRIPTLFCIRLTLSRKMSVSCQKWVMGGYASRRRWSCEVAGNDFIFCGWNKWFVCLHYIYIPLIYTHSTNFKPHKLLENRYIYHSKQVENRGWQYLIGWLGSFQVV